MPRGKAKPNFDERKITVMGQVVVAKSVDAALSDVDSSFKKTSALLAYWSSVHGSALKEQTMVDGQYRAWRARRYLEIVEKAKAKAGKGKPVKVPNVDTIKATIEADEKFLEMKSAIGTAAENVTIAAGMVNAYGKRANLTQSVGAKERLALETQGKDATKGKGRQAEEEDDEEEEDEDDPAFEEDDDEETEETSDDDEEEEVDEDEDEGGEDEDEEPAEESDEDDDEEEESDEDDDEDDDDDDDEDEEPPRRRKKKTSKKKAGRVGKKAGKKAGRVGKKAGRVGKKAGKKKAGRKKSGKRRGS